MLRNLLLSSALALCALPAMARDNHALLIGAAEYVNLKERWWLKGPKNDMALVSTYLTTEAPVPFAPANVTVLADLDGHDPATLANIRKGFADLTARVQPGDFVYLHFSGHGTQAPAKDPEAELDGLDELFLPVDIGSWSDSVGAVENALVDDEIGTLIDGIRAKGADVWVVFDSCHSGTATRAVDMADDDVRMRQLEDEALAELGIPQGEGTASRSLGEAPPAAPEDMTDTAAPDAEGMGSLVAFYAAQTNEVTPEKNLPKGDPARKPTGVFTYTLFETLAEYPSATYGQLAQEVLRKYALGTLAKATPLFEGDLDRVVFGAEPGTRIVQWQATQADGVITLPAGSLHGLSLGTELAVMQTAADATEDAIGRVKVTALDTWTATVEPVEGEVARGPEALPPGTYLRKLSSDVDFSLTVALPPAGSIPGDLLLAALADLQTQSGPRLNFVASGAEADLALAVLPESDRPDAIWVLPGSGIAGEGSAPSVGTEGRSGAEVAVLLADTLTTMSKALNLMKLGAALGPGDLDVTVQMQTRTPEDATLRSISATEVPVLVPDDQVHVLAENNTDGPVDVNVLYIGADYSISHWFAGRLHPGDQLKKGLFKITDSALGQERMIVVVTPASQHSKVEDLSFLAQPALEATRQIGGEGGFDALMAEAGFGETTRGAMALDDPGAPAGPAPMILQIELRTARAE